MAENNAAENNAAMGRALASTLACTAWPSGLDTIVTDCGTAASSKFPKTIEPNSLVQPRSPTYMQTQMHAQPASTDHETPPTMTHCTGIGPVPTPTSKNTLMNSSLDCMRSAGYNGLLAPNPLEVYTFPEPQHVRTRNSCRDFAKAPETKGKCSVALGEPMHSPHRGEK